MEECEKKYREYLSSHIKYVEMTYNLLLPSIKKMGLSEQELQQLKVNIEEHDKSKFTKEEFIPYCNYFYGDKTEETITEFKKAVHKHETRNPHHLEYWAEKKESMPTIYLIEMVCDWWSFSLRKKEPLEVLEWYNKNKPKMNLSDNECAKIGYLFEEIKNLNNNLQNL